jgi:hypothetical protein
MPRYFFHVHIGGDAIRDPDGQELRDPDRAWEVARAMARSLMAARFEKPVDWTSSHVEVTDEAGDVVLEFPFVEAMLEDGKESSD